VDLSALIFVALAVAWAAYLVPKALKHHEEVHRSRSVERFSHTMRVLARREPVSRRAARLVVTPMRNATRPRVETKASMAPASEPAAAAPAAPASGAVAGPSAVRRPVSASAARRRRRVLGLLVLAALVVGGLAAFSVIHWGWIAAPAALLVGWLVACRLMVRGGRARRVVRPSATAHVEPAVSTADTPVADAEVPVAPEGPAAEEPELAPGTWQMVPTTLPTYVDKPAAVHRTVQTIDLESTGVWSSGRNDSDSRLAREAEQAERSAREQANARRVSGA
jgi:hypothetical protein